MVRIGIIEAGGIAMASCRDFVSHPDAELVAVAEPDSELEQVAYACVASRYSFVSVSPVMRTASGIGLISTVPSYGQ